MYHRRHKRPIYLLLLLLLTPLIQGRISAQTTTWWYPLGNLGATRQAGDTTRSQTTNELNIKWRTTALRNSSTILVGGIRSGPGDLSQQIVGLTNDSLIILSSNGLVDTIRDYRKEFFSLSQNLRLTLTGLFNTQATSPEPTGRPVAIGIGVERSQKPSTGGDLLSLYGFLAGRNGEVLKKLSIASLPTTFAASNQIAGIYPIAAYQSPTPIALAVVSQNAFVVPTGSEPDTMVNSLRRYDLQPAGDVAISQWAHRIAPRTYPQPPALVNLAPDPSIVALSTEPYQSGVSLTINPFSQGDNDTISVSSKQYAISVVASDPMSYVDSRPLPLAPTQTTGEVHGYIVRMAQADATVAPDGYYRLAAENYDGARQGRPQLYMNPARVKESQNQFRGIFFDPNARNIGWSIATADLDGRDTTTDNGRYSNGPGDEIVAAFRRIDADNVDIDTNRLYLLKYNGPSNTLSSFARQRFSGRLLATGDLVADNLGRKEVLIAHDDTLMVLQLKNYSDESFDSGDDPKPFATIRSFVLDAPIVSAAIADLEGDGENDIIVCTERSTYAIGRRTTRAFDPLTIAGSEFCQPDTVVARWRRKIGGLDNISITLTGNGSPVVIDANYPGHLDSFALHTTGLAEGTYRIVVRDNAVPDLSDTSGAFTISTPSIASFTIAPGPTQGAYSIGDTVKFSTTLHCLDSMRVQRSYDGLTWEDAPATIQQSGADRSVSLRQNCPTSQRCGDSSRITVRVRVVDLNGIAVAQSSSYLLDLPTVTLSMNPPATDTTKTRLRTIGWPVGTFACDSVTISASSDAGASWTDIAIAPSANGGANIRIPTIMSGAVKLKVCCSQSDGASCEHGTIALTIGETPTANFVAPNPFNPDGPPSDYGDGAAIVYRLKQAGTVRVTIVDAGRNIVAVLSDGQQQEPARPYIALWNGRNSRGEIVANGTYICLIESSSSERIVLPIIVLRR